MIKNKKPFRCYGYSTVLRTVEYLPVMGLWILLYLFFLWFFALLENICSLMSISIMQKINVCVQRFDFLYYVLTINNNKYYIKKQKQLRVIILLMLKCPIQILLFPRPDNKHGAFLMRTIHVYYIKLRKLEFKQYYSNC